MECNPVHSIKALDPWCETHRKSVILCIREMNLQNNEFQKVLEEIVAASTRPEPMWDSPAALLLQVKKMARAVLTTPLKRDHDTCENGRGDGGEIFSRFCSEFERNPHRTHSPTCQFFQK